MLCGDWNARVGNGARPNYVVCDLYIDYIDDEDCLPNLPLQRQSMNNVCNSHGLKLLDLCKATSLRVANGRLGNDCIVGTYTYSSRNGCSVIDYLVLSQQDFSCLTIFKFNRFVNGLTTTRCYTMLCVALFLISLTILSIQPE